MKVCDTNRDTDFHNLCCELSRFVSVDRRLCCRLSLCIVTDEISLERHGFVADLSRTLSQTSRHVHRVYVRDFPRRKVSVKVGVENTPDCGEMYIYYL